MIGPRIVAHSIVLSPKNFQLFGILPVAKGANQQAAVNYTSFPLRRRQRTELRMDGSFVISGFRDSHPPVLPSRLRAFVFNSLVRLA